MNKTITIHEFVEFINKKIKPVKVVISLLTNRLNHSKGNMVELPKEELGNIIAVIQSFIDDFECINIKQPLGTKESKVVHLPGEAGVEDYQEES